MSSANYPVTGTSGGGGGLQHNVQAGYQGGPIYNHQGMIGQYCYNEGEWVVQAGGPVAMYPPLQQHSFDHAGDNYDLLKSIGKQYIVICYSQVVM